ncbi:MAG TPA: hypothetical protein VMK05_14675 [Burkholderiales bacterium]|nr:hypothetical protein [Burkholderiales bacterium]
MATRAGSSFVVRAYRGAGNTADAIVGIVEMPGRGGARAFKSVEELCCILLGDDEQRAPAEPDTSAANWGVATERAEPAV